MQYPNQFHDLLEQVRNKVESTTPVPKPEPAEKLLPTPLEIHNRLSETVIGHSEAKLALAVAVYNHAMHCAMADIEGGEGAQTKAEHNVWLCGPTASGKTLLLETLGKLVGLPVLHLDCANLAPHGYKGTTVSQHLETLASQLVENGRTHPAIVVLDEGDKLRAERSEFGAYRAMVQRDFLQFLGGSMCGPDLSLDGSRILTVLCGAFEGLELLRDRSKLPTIGFRTDACVSAEDPGAGGLPPLGPDELIEYGFMREFVGRFSRFILLDRLDVAAMKKILTEAAGNPLARRREFFRLHGVTLTFTDDAISEIATLAAARPTGARSLREFIDLPLRSIQHYMPHLAEEGVREVVVDREVVLGLNPPSEIRAEPVPVPERLINAREVAARYREKVLKPRSGDDD